MALLRAASSYNPRKHDQSFAAYALPRIRAAIHLALHEYFLTVRVPVRATKLADSKGPEVNGGCPPVTSEMSYKIAGQLTALQPILENEETLWHAVRQRYERAIRLAMADMQTRTWQGRHTMQIMERIVEERLLVPSFENQTSLRQLARDFHCYLSRVATYERLLLRAIRHHFSSDPRLPLLVQFAREDERGFAGKLNSDHRRRLLQAEVGIFQRRFSQLDRPAKAELVYAMIERSTATVSEVACNLYRLTCEPAPRPEAHVA